VIIYAKGENKQQHVGSSSDLFLLKEGLQIGPKSNGIFSPSDDGPE